MYLDSEITHQNKIIDENDPKASWPDIHICCSTLSGQYIRSRDDVHVVPMLPAFAPRIFGTSHTMREEIIDVFLTEARITIHSGLTTPSLYLVAFLHKFGTPRVFELVHNLKFNDSVHKQFDQQMTGLIHHCKNRRYLEIRLRADWLTD
jgi:hypothetical protein